MHILEKHDVLTQRTNNGLYTLVNKLNIKHLKNQALFPGLVGKDGIHRLGQIWSDVTAVCLADNNSKQVVRC